MRSILFVVPLLLTPLVENDDLFGPSTQIDSTSFLAQLTDNGIYRIKNKATQCYLSVPNFPASINDSLVFSSETDNENQRFVFQKQFGNTYRVRPVGNQGMVVDMPSFLEGSPLSLSEENYSEYQLFSDKFAIEQGRGNYFLIRPVCAIGGGYLKGGSGNDNRPELTFDAPNNDLFLWSFEKTDNLGIYVSERWVSQPNSQKRFLFRPPFSCTYQFSTVGPTNGLVILRKNSDHSYIASYSSGNFAWTLDKDETYEILYINQSATSCINRTKVSPVSRFFHYGLFDIDRSGPTNRAAPFLNLSEEIEEAGFFPINFTNLSKNELLSANKWNKPMFSSTFSIFSGHGGPGAVTTNDGVTSECFSWNEIPAFSGTTLMAWYACSSATNTAPDSNGNRTNMAKQSVINGADYSFGYNGSVFTIWTAVHKQHLIHELLTESSPIIAILHANISTRDDLPSLYLQSINRNMAFVTDVFYYNQNEDLVKNSMFSSLSPEEFENPEDEVSDFVRGDTFFTNLRKSCPLSFKFRQQIADLRAKYDRYVTENSKMIICFQKEGDAISLLETTIGLETKWRNLEDGSEVSLDDYLSFWRGNRNENP